jgi:hypothetical protein
MTSGVPVAAMTRSMSAIWRFCSLSSLPAALVASESTVSPAATQRRLSMPVSLTMSSDDRVCQLPRRSALEIFRDPVTPAMPETPTGTAMGAAATAAGAAVARRVSRALSIRSAVAARLSARAPASASTKISGEPTKTFWRGATAI